MKLKSNKIKKKNSKNSPEHYAQNYIILHLKIPLELNIVTFVKNQDT
jgi:hypothetical protein